MARNLCDKSGLVRGDMRTQKHSSIMTKDKEGLINGFLLPIYNVNEKFIVPDDIKQVYISTVRPGLIKGPHLHKKRWDYFTCIVGNCKFVIKTGSGYEEYFSGERFNYLTVEVPPDIPCAFQNVFDREAIILSTPNPAWTPEDQDDWPVTFDDYVWEWELPHEIRT